MNVYILEILVSIQIVFDVNLNFIKQFDFLEEPVALTTFRTLWRQLFPFVAVIRPATDLC